MPSGGENVSTYLDHVLLIIAHGVYPIIVIRGAIRIKKQPEKNA